MLNRNSLSTEDVYKVLYSYCCWGSLERIKALLKEYQYIDVTYDEGSYLRIAMEKGDYEILDILLSHYELTQLTAKPGTTEYQVAKHKLQVVLDNILEVIDVDKAILERINPYITSPEGSERDDLSELDDTVIDPDRDSMNTTDETDNSGHSDEEVPGALNLVNINNLKKSIGEESQALLNQWLASTALEEASPSNGKTLNSNPEGDGTSTYTDSSYWNRYSKEGLKNILDLRLKSSGIVMDEAVVIHPNYVFSEQTAQVFVNDLVAQISSTGLGVEGGNNSKSKLLIPVNLYGKHWVGMVLESADSKIKVTYMDSEGNSMPATLKECLEAELTWIYPNAGIEVTELVVEQQVSNNCGLHVIESLIAAVAGEAGRLEQENFLAVHTTLYEQTLLEEAWPGGKTINGSVEATELAYKQQTMPEQQTRTALQTLAEPWYYGAEKVIASMAGKIVGSFVDALRMAMYVDPHDITSMMQTALQTGGCAVPDRTPDRPELREALLQYRIDSQTNASKALAFSLPFSNLLNGIELTHGDIESWLHQFGSKVPLTGE